MLRAAFAAHLLGALVSGRAIGTQQDQLPTVDLGYAIHQAVVNETGNYYSFNNIRYAEPPINQRRFRASVKVTTESHSINDGSVGFKCPQVYPEWALIEQAKAAGVSPKEMLQYIMADPTASEDCLFLDVAVPCNVFDNAAHSKDKGLNDGNSRKPLAPVMIWIHGGGYVFGHKNEEMYNPAGLLDRSQADGTDGIIYVAINYRLGLFGWLNGGEDEHILANAGLHDQRLAMEWVKGNINLFGGDPEDITVFGESSGAGSIMHHITAEGGKKAPFERALLQSPGWQTTVNVDQIWETTLATASQYASHSVTSANDLATLDSSTLIQINGAMVFQSTPGTFTYGPTVDGGYVPDLPGVLLLDGKFDSTPQIMLGHNLNEAALFVDPTIDTNEKARAVMKSALPGVDEKKVNYILDTLYPCIEETDAYKTEYERASTLISELSFICNTRYLATAFGNNTFGYRFQIPPGAHAQDVPWTFFNGNTTNLDPTMAQVMQMYFTSFGKRGNPNMEGILPEWPNYGDDADILTFGLEGIVTAVDDTKNERCAYWQKAEYRK